MLHSQPIIIAGPCSAESREQVLSTCSLLAQNPMISVFRAGVWKPRTRPGGFEGIGEAALEWVKEAARENNMLSTVEVATAAHVEAALKHGIDILWIGARTTVSPFAVQEIADAVSGTNVDILIKNPVSPDVALWRGAVERISQSTKGEVGLIHRGFSSYNAEPYRNAPMWHIALEMRRLYPELPMICDPSHIAGKAHLVKEIADEAAKLNYAGLIVESHCNPSVALSDKEQQLTPAELSEMLSEIQWPNNSNFSKGDYDVLGELRSQIDLFDKEIFELLAKRMDISHEIGMLKKERGVAILQSERWAELTARLISRSTALGLSADFTERVLEAIHLESIGRQLKIKK